MKVTYTEVYENLRQLSGNIDPVSYVYDFLSCFGVAKATLTRLKKKFSDDNEVISNGQIHFKAVSGNLEGELNEISQQKSLKKNKIRFVIVTDYKTVFASDLKAEDTVQLKINELHDEFEFFLPLAGMERASLATESVADAKAAEKMAKLFDLLKVENQIETEAQIHAMNVFLSRVLFCFFAEDTGIFSKDQFTKTIGSLSEENGSNVHVVMTELFEVLNTTSRDNCSNNFKSFPFVNGGLFAEHIDVPKFNVRSRRALIECGSLDWSQINPDIFGSMIQAVMDVKKRSEMGMHYTSVQNIMKVLSPLFLDKLTEEYLKILDSDVKDETKVKNLKDLCKRLSKIKVGDMACGSGNFLIIAYKELRQLEMKILKAINHIEGADEQLNLLFGAPQSGISLGQFYGIEYDDFACSIAILSLWLVEHQMNQQFNDEFGASEATLPLKSFNTIVHGNALRLDWNTVMPNCGEVYVVGNPPFLGARLQKESHKQDMALVFKGVKNHKNLDYVSGWFIKASRFIALNECSASAFVATNSICQGDAVSILWPNVLKDDIEIGFAHTSFKWTNYAKNKAAVICVIVSLQHRSSKPKYLFDQELKQTVSSINAYLVPAENVFVEASKKSLAKLPVMNFGNMPNDGGFLILEPSERDELIEEYPDALKFVKKLVGSRELINDIKRYCLWIMEEDIEEAMAIPPIQARIDSVREYRSKSTRAATNKLAAVPHRFAENRFENKDALIVPRHSSENRNYIPLEFFDSNTISTDANLMIYGCSKDLFSLLTSKIHNLWVATVGGRIKTDFRYSATVCYNTFPIPNLSNHDIQQLENFANRIIRERIMAGGTLAELYDPVKMPDELRKAHTELDEFVDTLYQQAVNRTKPLKTNTERLEVLFRMYAEMKEQS